MTDVEGAPFINPYGQRAGGVGPVFLHGHHPIVIMRRLAYGGISLYGLRHFNVYKIILRSPHVRHEWFKIGLASTIGKISYAFLS
jgi:hypothetical protein